MAPRPPSQARARKVRSASLDRKERRFEERARRIREEAQRLLLERGLHGFSMDDVAAAIDYSKGTVYQHYTSKEDALVASCAEACGEMAVGFEAAAAAPARPRARMLAIAEAYCAFVRGKSVSFRSIPLIHSQSVLEKARPERLEAMETARGRCLAVCGGLVRDAVARGDLVLPVGVRPELITFGLWALMFGAFMLAELHRPDGVLGTADPVDAIRTCWRAQMDGLGWRPLSGEDAGRVEKPAHPRRAGTGAARSGVRGVRRARRTGREEQR
jgi:AcrR family transcriptional regulator